MSEVVVRSCVSRAIQAVLDRHRSHVVALDTETTGLSGAVIQAALVELSASGDVVDVFCGIIPPPQGYHLEAGAVAVHGITRERIQMEAQPAKPFLEELMRRIKGSLAEGKKVVAHNSAFDKKRLNETLRAHGMEQRLEADDVFCTMRSAKRHCGLRDRRGAHRCPKNVELYDILVGTGGGAEASSAFGSLHDAAVDARITAHAFLAGRRRGWWS